MPDKKSCVQVYTGNGKGKTTAAIGISIRCAGAGFSVYFGQFLKDGNYSESESLKLFGDSIKHETFGHGGFIRGEPSDEDRRTARNGFEKIREAALSGRYRLVVADEINVAVSKGLVSADEVLELMRTLPESVELVLTGRYASEEIIAAADLVTEMCEIKHYYSHGIPARKGIEK
ncbi:cob(I)yrinic acid a,c-diamide adenosyltransferase [Geovibrio thiophilus]|uniref:corrinoid adenosyltransferase n=1 Tax=Geovibrio thiophilus TaxID=139438 RepID=A0A410JZF5_9BACT|nr:cob(I)yrinic acid a,c-diamide adenosyltransferase [Geovibrio thiophilus]QAR33431.1 cob(I)yrinic acid a,c-diamide adenosyltransferase [Geovibrio thiophilus]